MDAGQNSMASSSLRVQLAGGGKQKPAEGLRPCEAFCNGLLAQGAERQFLWHLVQEQRRKGGKIQKTVSECE